MQAAVTPCFTDRACPPSEPTIAAALGRAAGAWSALLERLRTEDPDVRGSWRFYADGQRWLFRATRGSKTVFWLTLGRGAFRVMFYFPARSRLSLARAAPASCKAAILEATPSGKLLPVGVTFGPRSGVSTVMALIGLKQAAR